MASTYRTASLSIAAGAAGRDVASCVMSGREGAVAETKNVFISHVHKDDHGLQKLKDLLAPKGMDVRDSSIHVGKFNNASDPNYIKTQILAPAINWAGTFICYVSPQTKGGCPGRC